MDFAVREEARTWFKEIRPDLTIDFDIFYFCFIAGIKMVRKEDATSSDTASLVDYFPGAYKTRGRLLVALFLSRELNFLGVTIDEREIVHREIAKLVNPDAPNHLSDDGVREFNRYAHGGYDVLREWFDDRPRTLETFLRMFYLRIQEPN